MSIAATTCRWRRISICLSGARKSFPRWGDPDRSSADAHRRQDHGLSGQRLRRPQQFPGRRQREDPQRHPPSGIVGRRRARSGTAPSFRRVAAAPYPAYRGLSGSHLAGPVSAAPPGDAIRLGAALPGGGWRLTRPTGASHRITPPRPGKRSATGRCHQARSRFIAGWRLRLARPTASHTITPRRPGKRSATGRCHQARSRFIAGWRLAPYPAYRSLSQAHTS